MGRLVAVAVITLALAACSDETPDSITVTPDSVSGWPLTVDEGELRCEMSAVTIEVDGVVYSVNGMADGRAGEEGWADIDPIWAEDPDGVTPRADLEPLINLGLALCE